jgi:hypothetical protein
MVGNKSGGERGILNQAFELCSHVLSNMRENRMDIGDFHLPLLGRLELLLPLTVLAPSVR